MVFWLLFSNESIQNILILSATVAPFASAGIRPVVNRLNQDTTVYYGLVFCLFSWPSMVKWHNCGIIKLVKQDLKQEQKSFKSLPLHNLHSELKRSKSPFKREVSSEGRQVWRQDVPLSKSALLIFMFLHEKLISKLVIHHVSFLKVNT